MKFLSLIAGFCSLLFLSACGGEDLDRFTGRWSHDERSIIMQIEKVGDNSLQVERIFVTALHQIESSTRFATVKDGIMTLGEGAFAESIRFDEKTGRLIDRKGTFSKVPDGWMWRDGDPN